MKNFRKLFAVVLAFALVIGLAQITPAEAKAKKQIGVPIQVNGADWFDPLIYGGYTEEGFIPKVNADYSVSYVLYVPLRAFDEWMLASIDPEGGWAEPDDPVGKFSIAPCIYWHSEERQTDYRLETFNFWDVNHAHKAGDEFIIDGLWTPEDGSLFVDDVEGEGVMKAELIGDMVKITVKDLKATSREINYFNDENNWEPIPFEGSFDGKEDMLLGFYFNQWIGGDEVETVYLASASIKMGKKTIWKASVSTEWYSGNVSYDTGNKKEDGGVEFGNCEVTAVPFNTSFLTLAKDTVSVKAKKSVSVKYTTMNTVASLPAYAFENGDITLDLADKVTVKTSDKKIATASIKNGKIKIKGKKKGTASIIVSSNGINKEIKVTVK